MLGTNASISGAALRAMCREDELILCCARSSIDDASAGRIYSLLAQEIDWSHFLDRIIHHRVTPLVHRTLLAFPRKAIPADVLQKMTQRCSAIARRNLHLAAEMIRLGAWFDTAEIPFVAYKGPALAALAYGNIALREFGDLDILVRSTDYQKTREGLQSLGFRLCNDLDWECSLVDDQRAISIDVHESLTPRVFRVALPFERIHGRVTVLPVAGATMRTFCVEDMLLVLCVQLTKDAWGPRSVRMSKLCDIAELLRRHPKLDWQAAIAEARRFGILRMLHVGSIVAQDLLGAPLLPAALGNMRDDGTERLASHVIARLLNEADEPANGPLSSGRFYFMIRERWREKAYPWYLNLRERLVPNDRDRAVVSLPESLHFLYFIVRAFRVSYKYAKGGVKRLKFR